MMRKTMFSLMAVALTTACLDMDVENLNAPDAERALAEADDVEALLGTGYYQFWSATQKHYPGISAQVAAGTQTMAWGNFGSQHVGTQPRLAWDNSPTFNYRGVNQTPWGGLYTAISNVNDGLLAMDELGVNFLDENGADMNPRARAYAKFIQGISHGFLAMYYDQAMIFDETVDLEDGVPEMVPYTEVMDAAIGYLEEALTLLNSNTFTLPTGESGWIHDITVDNQDLIIWTHTFIARYLSGVARTPTERAAADWNKIIQHARQGFDNNTETGPVFDGGFSWWDGPKYYAMQAGAGGAIGGGWNRASLDLVGLADTSGAYQAWASTTPADRVPFIVRTADRRVTGPGGHPADGKYFAYVPAHGGNLNEYPAGRGMYFQSGYATTRFNYVRFEGRDIESMPVFTKAEMDLLEAEGLLRTGNKNAAIDLINITRTENGELPPLPYTISADEAFKAMMYEKLMETTITWAALPYFDKRGWGTLICGTPLHYPVPGTELEQLQLPNYTFGGVGGDMAASQANGGCQP